MIGRSQRRNEMPVKPACEQHVARRVGARHRERAGAAGRLVVLLGARDELLDDLLRAVQPLVVDPLPPHDHHELGARHERAADVAQRGDRVVEEHRPEARERAVERAVEREALLDVGDGEVRVRDARRILDRGLDEARRGVDPDRLALRADQLGDLPRAVTEAAADVEHALAGLRRMQPQRLVAVARQAGREEVLEAHEALEQRAVPRGDRLRVDARSPARFHAGDHTLGARACGVRFQDWPGSRLAMRPSGPTDSCRLATLVESVPSAPSELLEQVGERGSASRAPGRGAPGPRRASASPPRSSPSARPSARAPRSSRRPAPCCAPARAAPRCRRRRP